MVVHRARGLLVLLSTLSVTGVPGAGAFAACPQELAVYAEAQAEAGLEFLPVDQGVATSNSFKIRFPEKAVTLDGVVMWTDDVARPTGIVMHNCPEGDVTGEELEACTVWQGVIYAVHQNGTVGLLPRQGEPAAAQILLPDLANGIRYSSAYGADGLSKLPWDVFAMSGCQE